MHLKLRDRKRWENRVGLANLIHQDPEILHNTRRLVSSQKMLTSAEFECQHSMATAA